MIVTEYEVGPGAHGTGSARSNRQKASKTPHPLIIR
jgi:hypothetical protein